jgi:hypothetical protein
VREEQGVSLGLHLPLGRRREAQEVRDSLRLDCDRCTGGDTVHGTADGPSRGARVALVRVERRPAGVGGQVVAETRSSPVDGSFALTVPSAVLPTAAGERCALAYVVSASAKREAPCRELVVLASAVPHLDCGSWRADRLLRHFDARHFHIELFEAELRGGGRLVGRVHRHGTWPAAALVVTARCLECWRSPPYAERGAPLWHEAALWEEERPLRTSTDSHWARFRFELPAELPPAVEARTIAWRYELLARGHVHRWFKETAAITPLLHEEHDDIPPWAAAVGLRSRRCRLGYRLGDRGIGEALAGDGEPAGRSLDVDV